MTFKKVATLLAIAATAITSTKAQRSGEYFEGAPAPADFPQEEGVPIENNASAVDIDRSLDTSEFLADIPFSFSFAFREGYDDNLFTTETNRYGSFYSNLAGGIEYTAENSRLQLQAAINGGVTYYYSRPGDKFDYTGGIELSGVYQLTPRLTISFSTNTAYLAQPDLTIAGGTNRQNGDYLYSSTTIAGAYQWSEKFSTETKYNFTPFLYVDENLNENQGRIEQTIGQSFKWLILPKTTGVIEYRANPVTYYAAPLNNFGQFGLLGVDQIFNPKFKVSARGGVEFRIYNPENNNQYYVGPFAELNGLYQYQRFSTIGLNLRYGTEASGLDGSATRQTFRIGLNVVQGITPKLSFNAGLNYLNNFYDEFDKNENASDFYENIIEFTVGANFQITKSLTLQAGYAYTIDMAPAAEQLSYQRNVAFVGLNANF